MKITRIVQQAKVRDRYSIFVDGAYAFSLSEQALLESRLAPGTELAAMQIREWKQRSDDDKAYTRAIRYAALRPRSRWEVEQYLYRKDVPPALALMILNKLSNIHLLDDRQFARAFVSHRRLLRSSSKLKLQHELRAKHVPDGIIMEVLSEGDTDEQAVLRTLIIKKRTLTKYRTDDQRLMQYLARQGFPYEDIKTALRECS